MTAAYEAPRWLRDLQRFLPLKSQFVLSGNVRDLQAIELQPGLVAPQGFIQALAGTLIAAGYAQVVLFDPVAGFQVATPPGASAQTPDQVLQGLGLSPVNGVAAAGIDLLGLTLERLINAGGEPLALIVDFASQLLARADAPSPAEHQLFTRALVASHQARARPAGSSRKPLYNAVLWVVDKEGDLPDWLLVGNPRLRHVPVARPDQIVRRALARALL